MPEDNKSALKITMSALRKKEIHLEARRLGFASTSKYVLACIEGAPWLTHIEMSRDIMHTFQQLAEFETNGSNLPRKERRALAARIRDRLIDLCSDRVKT